MFHDVWDRDKTAIAIAVQYKRNASVVTIKSRIQNCDWMDN